MSCMVGLNDGADEQNKWVCVVKDMEEDCLRQGGQRRNHAAAVARNRINNKVMAWFLRARHVHSTGFDRHPDRGSCCIELQYATCGATHGRWIGWQGVVVEEAMYHWRCGH